MNNKLQDQPPRFSAADIRSRLSLKLVCYRKVMMLVAAMCLACFQPLAGAVDKSAVKEKWHTPFDLYLSPREAYEMKSADPDNVLFIDVRTRAEIQFVGFTDMVDANIPIYVLSQEWKHKADDIHGSYRKLRNEHFVTAVDNLLTAKDKDKSAPIILMCQSGGRSPKAARELHEAGYQNVYFQVEGFEGIKAKEGPDTGKRIVNGWKKAGLPWSYKLKTEKMYFNFAPDKE
jgi:rhodanese-related sulfurtransferase